MSKELVIAIVIGIFVGLVVTYGIYTANQALSSRNKNTLSLQNTTLPTPTPSTITTLNLSLLAPEDGLAVTNSEITVEGTSAPNSVVAIVTEDNELMTETDSLGHFSQPVTLIRGANTLQITASDTNQLSITKTVKVVYTTDLETAK
jgi:hypothetical protein